MSCILAVISGAAPRTPVNKTLRFYSQISVTLKRDVVTLIIDGKLQFLLSLQKWSSSWKQGSFWKSSDQKTLKNLEDTGIYGKKDRDNEMRMELP